MTIRNQKGKGRDYTVTITWEKNVLVQTTDSEYIPGLVLESGSSDALIELVRYVIPELLEQNKREKGGTVSFKMVRKELVANGD